MLGFKAAKADVGQWVRGPNAEQKHSLPLVTCSQWAWSPLQGTHSAWAIQRAPGPQISHTAYRESPVSLSLFSLSVHHSVCHSTVPKISSTARNQECTKQFKPFMTECESVWWRWNDSSVNQGENKYLFKTFPLTIKSKCHNRGNIQVR